MKTDIPYSSFSKFILRAPLFPLNLIDEIPDDKKELHQYLKKIFNISVVEEAIYLASPDLHSQLNKFLNLGKNSSRNPDKLYISFLKYLLRMSVRPTPFGLFSGFVVGSVSAETDVSLMNMEKYKRFTRLDMNYLCRLSADLAADHEIKEKLLFYPNNSIYNSGDQIRYVEFRYINSKRQHHLVSVDRSPYMEKVLKAASKGVLLKDLIAILHNDEVNHKEASDFINELIESQILISELDPALTGPGILEQILTILNRIKYEGEIIGVLKDVNKMINELDSNGILQLLSGYEEIYKRLKQLKTDISTNSLFQLDMKISAERCTLKQSITSETLEGITVLKKLSINTVRSRLSDFKRVFSERYDEDEIPLSEAIDPDIGIGYGTNTSGGGLNPLIDDVNFPLRSDGIKLQWDDVQSFYLKKYLQSLKENKYEVTISDKDLEHFDCKWDDFPDTFATLVRIIQNNGSHKIVLEQVGGSVAGNLMGRFCYADNDLCELGKEISDKENSYHKNAIIAEIIHLPQSRTGNILQRPRIREFELPYLGKSSLPESRQIKVSDLYVSVKNDKIVLRSKQRNKTILPRLTTAHNFSNDSLAIYQFLCDMQLQDKVHSVRFDWGLHSDEYEFLPRVSYKNIILSLASWNISIVELRGLFEITNEDHLIKRINDWRRNHQMPERVQLCESDNEILIDFNNKTSLMMFLSMVKNKTRFLIKEFLFDKGNCIVTSKQGGFTNEFLIPFFKEI